MFQVWVWPNFYRHTNIHIYVNHPQPNFSYFEHSCQCFSFWLIAATAVDRSSCSFEFGSACRPRRNWCLRHCRRHKSKFSNAQYCSDGKTAKLWLHSKVPGGRWNAVDNSLQICCQLPTASLHACATTKWERGFTPSCLGLTNLISFTGQVVRARDAS